MRIDFDSVWKDTTEVYFAALLELFEPQALPKVPDHEPLSFLDQEMQQLAQVLGDEGAPEGEMGAGANPGSNPDDGRTTGQWACFEKMESKIEVSLGFAGWS